jgi:hypothetical protein
MKMEAVLKRWVTRFYPGNVHVCGLSIHEERVGPSKLDGGRTKIGNARDLPRFSPLKGKDLCPACLTLLMMRL